MIMAAIRLGKKGALITPESDWKARGNTPASGFSLPFGILDMF